MDGSIWGTGGPDPPGKLQVAKGFLRNTGTDPPELGLYGPPLNTLKNPPP